MKSIFSTIIDHPKSLFIGSSIFISIFLISLLFPKHNQFNYDYSIGKAWNYPDLVANSDFYVWKTKTEMNGEKEIRISRFRPIYAESSDPNAIYAKLEKDVKANIDKLNEATANSILSYVQSSYDKPIIEESDLNYKGNPYESIRIEGESSYISLEPEQYVLTSTLDRLITPLRQANPELSLEYIVATHSLDKIQSDAKLSMSIEDIVAYKHKIDQGSVIISQEEIVTETKFENLQALKTGSNATSFYNSIIFLGYILLTCLIIGVYIFFLLFHYPELFDTPKQILFLLMAIVGMSFLVYSVEHSAGLSSYLIPFCIVPIIVKSFFSDRLALFTHIVIVLIASFLSVLDYEFTFLQILAGIVAVLVIEDTKSWNKFFISIFSILAAYYIGYLGLCLIKFQTQVPIDWNVFKWLTLSGVFTLLAYPFIPLLAKVFGFVCTITLTDLSDLNMPLLKRLSINAPGTLQHSLQVANLAEAAGEEVGANSLLLKVGALYHDIGKLHNPSIFIENQNGGLNPHDNLSNFESARAIIDHTTEGVKMAKKANLPKPMIDIIQSHHGTTRVEFFYRNQLNDFPDREFDEELFRYPGPKPQTKEESILMLADSLEAASKSLKNPYGKDIDDLVENIVDFKIKNEQLSESELSFDELEKCKKVFKAMLRNINHVRVEYPKVKSEEE